ncbi:CAAX prenyl protease 2-like [Clavelina lepadiformis]|uniref:CAAX prenyl protease 2 n=1 Tax=Clavelina lepadiformis TaxID=159417 RepID=A0ABP0GNE7_CLALP
MFVEVCYDHISKVGAILSCLAFAILYVGSLYIKSQRLPRDHPKTIKERILRVSLASALACVILFFSSSNSTSQCQSATFLEWIGIRFEGLIPAVFLPSFLIIILFLGPVVMLLIDHGMKSLFSSQMSDITIWRNYFVAPLSEELVFRGCMLPLLVPAFGKFTSILLAPWFFGLAHIHHASEQYKTGSYPLSTIVASTLFQASYTTIFGILSSYIFLRTGHLISAFISHALCNMMGFPEFEHALTHRHNIIISLNFVLGLASFIIILGPLTKPSIYGNTLYGDEF